MKQILKNIIRDLIIKEFNLKKNNIKNLSTQNIKDWDSLGIYN